MPCAAAAAEAAAVWGPEPGDSGRAGGGSSRASIRSALGDLPAVASFLSSSSLAPSAAPSEQLEIGTGAATSIVTSAAELSAAQEHEVEALTQDACAALHQAAAMAALADPGSFLSIDHTTSSRMPSMRPSMASAEPAVLTGGPAPTSAAPSARRHPADKQGRSKAAQCSLLQLESRGCQVAAWELAVAPEEGSGVIDAAVAAAPPAKDEDPETTDADQDAEAMEAMQAALLLPPSSSSSPGHGMHSARPSELPSSRASMTGAAACTTVQLLLHARVLVPCPATCRLELQEEELGARSGKPPRE